MLAVEAFRATDPVTFEETWSTDSIVAITEGAYRRAYLGSLQLSVITAVLGAVLGLALAVAVLQTRRNLLLRRLVLTASGVLANFGGIPLAFAFLATIGNAGVVTALLHGHPRARPRRLQPVLDGRAGAGLPVLPDPADGPDHHARARGAAAAVAGGGRQPRRQRLAVLALRRRPGAGARR